MQMRFEMPAICNDTYVNAIEHTMLLLLIISRWLLPKGDITRDQLSQLLFVYIAVASDIMELHTLFEERPVLNNILLTHCIMAVWTLSLIQFTLVLTATKEKKAESEDDPGRGCCETVCCESEVWSILITVFCQDGPFLAVRLYSLAKYHIKSYTTIFFTSKNILVILLQFYRMVVLGREFGTVHPAQQEPSPENKAVPWVSVQEMVPEASPDPAVILDDSDAKKRSSIDL